MRSFSQHFLFLQTSLLFLLCAGSGLFGSELYPDKIEIRAENETEWLPLEKGAAPTWDSTGIGDIVWFRFHFSGTNPLPDKIAFSPGTVSSSFEIFHNQQLIGKKGTIKRFCGLPWTGRFEVIELPESFMKNGPEILEMRIQSFSLTGGLIGDPPKIGDLKELSAEQLRQNWKPSLILVAVLVLLIGIFILSLLFVPRIPRDVLGWAFIGGVFSEMCEILTRCAILFNWTVPIQTLLTSLTILFWGFLSYPLWLFIISRLADIPISRRLKNFFFISLGVGLLITCIGFRPSNTLYFSGILMLFLTISFVWGWVLILQTFRKKTRARWFILIAWLCGHAAFFPTGASEVGRWISPLNFAFFIPIFIFATFIFQRAVDDRKRAVLLADRVVTVQEDERRMLARELHDGAAQNLQALKLQLELRGDSKISETEREEVIRWLEMTSQEIRQSARHLHPSVLEKMSLSEAMEDYSNHLRNTGLEIQLQTDDTLKFSKLVAGNLYRIFQEAVANAIHHGEASFISVTLKKNAVRNRIELIIADNGKGGLSESPGMGRRSVQERAELIGATAEWTEKAGVTLAVYLKTEE